MIRHALSQAWQTARCHVSTRENRHCWVELSDSHQPERKNQNGNSQSSDDWTTPAEPCSGTSTSLSASALFLNFLVSRGVGCICHFPCPCALAPSMALQQESETVSLTGGNKVIAAIARTLLNGVASLVWETEESFETQTESAINFGAGPPDITAAWRGARLTTLSNLHN